MHVTRRGDSLRGGRSVARTSLTRSNPARILAISLCVIALLAPAAASASPDTLRRSFSNIINGPFDMLLSPVVGGLTLARNIRDIDDSATVRVVYALPGWLWLTGLNFGAGSIRTVTGVLEVVPGTLLFPFSETDIDTLFDPVDDAGALVEWDNPVIDFESPWIYYNPIVVPFAITIKFGINYTVAEN
jgi:hypothetical protein